MGAVVPQPRSYLKQVRFSFYRSSCLDYFVYVASFSCVNVRKVIVCCKKSKQPTYSNYNVSA